MTRPGSIVIRSPCPRCTWSWLPRATLGDTEPPRPGSAPFEARVHAAPYVTVETPEGSLGPEPYYPHPDCPDPHDAVGPPSALDPRRAVVVGSLSPIKAMRTFRALGHGPQVRQAIADAPRSRPPRPFFAGCGVHADPAIAERIAISEVLERDCACRSPRAPIVYGSAPALRPSTVALDVDDQPRRWVEAAVANTGQVRLVPLEYVQLASQCTVPTPLVRGDSTGMAVHTRPELAVEVGLRELVERAALGDQWDRGARLRWRHDSLPPAARDLIDAMAAAGYDTAVLPMRAFSSYRTCLAVSRPREDARGLGVRWGASAASTTIDALLGALRELYGQLVIALATPPPAAWSGPDSSEVHRALGVDRIPWADYSDQAQNRAEPGGEVLVVDRGNALIDYVGLHARQVVVPSLYPPRREHPMRGDVSFPFH